MRPPQTGYKTNALSVIPAGMPRPRAPEIPLRKSMRIASRKPEVVAVEAKAIEEAQPLEAKAIVENAVAVERIGAAAFTSAATASKLALLPFDQRVELIAVAKEFDWAGEDGLPIDRTGATLLAGLTEMVTIYSGSEMVKCLVEEFGSLRDAFEKSTPITQCGNTIGPAVEGTECWICGGTIKSDGFLTPECEHVFPVAQALVFTGLYETQLYNELRETELTVAEAYRTGVTLEYKWAHQICNQIKSNIHFVTFSEDPSNKAPVSIDDAKIKDFLTKLETTPKYGTGVKLLRAIGLQGKEGVEAWKTARSAAISSVCNKLAEIANRSGLTTQEHSLVAMMAIKSYVATHEMCSSTPTQEPAGNPPLMAEPVNGVYRVSFGSIVAVTQWYIGSISDEVTGRMQSVLDTIGHDITARARAMISIRFAGLTNDLRSYLSGVLTDVELAKIRSNIYSSTKVGEVGEVDDATQRQTQEPNESNILKAHIATLVTDHLPELNVEDNLTLREGIARNLTEWKDSIVNVVTEVNPRWRDIVGPPPVGADPIPEWLHLSKEADNTAPRGGGKRIGGRRPLYG